MDEDLQQARYLYLLGAYQNCINNLKELSVENESQKLALIYRCYLAQKKFKLVLSELQNMSASGSSNELKAITSIAKLLGAPNSESKSTELKILEELSESSKSSEESITTALVAEYYMSQGMIEQALKATFPRCSSCLECGLMMVEGFLKLKRTDLAQSQLDKMRDISDEAIPTHLAEAAIALSNAQRRYQDAFYVYQELIETYGATPSLLVRQAISYMQMGKFSDAASLLSDSLGKAPEDQDTLSNLILCNYHRGLVDVEDYLSKLSEINPQYPLIQDIKSKELLFDELNAKLSS